MNITLNEKIDGYKLNAVWKNIEKGDHVLNDLGEVVIADCDHIAYRRIVLFKEPWIPKNGEEYFFISSGMDIIGCKNCDDSRDDVKRITNGNYFKTRLLAQNAKDKMLQILKKDKK